MKSRRKEFNEAVGVPEGIVDAGKRLYDDMKKLVIPMLDEDETEYELNFEPDEPYRIGDMVINDVEMKVTIHPVDTNEYGDSNMKVFRQQRLSDKGKSVVFMTVSPKGKIMLSMDIPVPLDWSVDELIKSLEKNKVKTVSSFSHELKHEYDSYKKEVEHPSHIADYNAKVKFIGFPVKALQRVFYDLYYMDKVENLVRPTELYAKLKTKVIKKSQFLDYFRKEYSHLLDAMKFNVDDLISELYENMDEVEGLLNNVDDLDKPVSEMSSEEKINALLKTAYISFSNISGENLMQMLVSNPLEVILGLGRKKGEYFDKHLSSKTKYENDQ